MKISICTPVYKMKDGLCEIFLVEFLSHLLYQTFKDFEVIVSDQSDTNELENICNIFSKLLDIKYVKNTSGINNAANNVNVATANASGEIIKLLYVDDFFVDQNALLKIYNAFQQNDGKWLINGFTHCNMDKTEFFNTKIPWYGNKYVNGDNTTGNPSTYAVRRECLLQMDENLKWIVDGEYFYQSYYYHGDPIIINDILNCSREHSDSAFMKDEFRELDAKERAYCEEKYKNMELA